MTGYGLSGKVRNLQSLKLSRGGHVLRVPNALGNGCSLPQAQKSKIQKIRKSKMQALLIFRCRYLPGIRLRNQHLGTWILRIRQTRLFETCYKLGKSDFPIFRFHFPISRSFRIFVEATEGAKHQSIGDPQGMLASVLSNPVSY